MLSSEWICKFLLFHIMIEKPTKSILQLFSHKAKMYSCHSVCNI